VRPQWEYGEQMVCTSDNIWTLLVALVYSQQWWLASISSNVGITLRVCLRVSFAPMRLCASADTSYRPVSVSVTSRSIVISSCTSWCRFSPPSNFLNGHLLTMWFMVYRWPQSQEGDCARPHLCKVLLKWLDRSSWFWHGGFLQLILHCVVTEFRYLQK